MRGGRGRNDQGTREGHRPCVPGEPGREPSPAFLSVFQSGFQDLAERARDFRRARNSERSRNPGKAPAAEAAGTILPKAIHPQVLRVPAMPFWFPCCEYSLPGSCLCLVPLRRSSPSCELAALSGTWQAGVLSEGRWGQCGGQDSRGPSWAPWKGRAGEQATSTRLDGRLPEEGLSQASVVAPCGEAMARPRWDMSLICLLSCRPVRGADCHSLCPGGRT